MPRILVIFLTLAFCSTAMADPLTYICERPAWDGKEGCGPNNTYYTYRLQLDTKDFDNKDPRYVFQMKKGCDASKGSKKRYHYVVSDETLAFKFKRIAHTSSNTSMSVIYLDRETLKAKMSNVEDSPNLTCRLEES